MSDFNIIPLTEAHEAAMVELFDARNDLDAHILAALPKLQRYEAAKQRMSEIAEAMRIDIPPSQRN